MGIWLSEPPDPHDHQRPDGWGLSGPGGDTKHGSWENRKAADLLISVGNGGSRDCQAAIEDLSESLLELENTDVPANYIVRLRAEQAGLRKAVLRVYQIQREEFLPSAHAMIYSFVVLILVLLAFTKIGTEAETLVTVAFLAFFFVYLLRLLDVITGRSRSGTSAAMTTSASSFSTSSWCTHGWGRRTWAASKSSRSPSASKNKRQPCPRSARRKEPGCLPGTKARPPNSKR